jgi:hypothetical protein
MGKRLPIALLAVVLLVGLVIGGTLFTIYGFATLSLSQADFRTSGTTLPNGEFWNNKLWILHVSQNLLAQRAIGTIDSDEIGSESGTASQKYFSIDMTFDKQVCEFPLSQEYGSMPLSDFTLQYWNVNQLTACDYYSYCSNPIASGEYAPLIGLKECWCMDEAVKASAIDKNIKEPNTRTTGSVVVGNDDGNEQTHYFDTHDPESTSTFVSSNVYFSWDGYHASDYVCPDSDEYYAYWSPYTGSWAVGFSTEYGIYEDKYTNIQINMLGKTGKPALQAVVDDLNDARLAAETSAFWGIIEGSNIDDTIVVHNIIDAIKYPQYIFYVKADWLGIEVMEPNIVITDAFLTEECFEGTGYVDIDLRNDGDSGNAKVSIGECSAGFDGSGPVTIGLASGESRTITRPVSASVSTKTTGTCTTVSNDGYHVSKKAFSVCAEPFKVCTPGEKKCFSDDTIRQCDAEGVNWEIIENCAIGEYCTLENGIPVCKGDGNDGKSCQTNTDCADSDPCTINERCEASWWGLGATTCVSDTLHTVECGCPSYMLGPIPLPDLLCLTIAALQGLFWALLPLIIIGAVILILIIGGIIIFVRVFR